VYGANSYPQAQKSNRVIFINILRKRITLEVFYDIYRKEVGGKKCKVLICHPELILYALKNVNIETIS
jgi:hypothetical protein